MVTLFKRQVPPLATLQELVVSIRSCLPDSSVSLHRRMIIPAPSFEELEWNNLRQGLSRSTEVISSSDRELSTTGRVVRESLESGPVPVGEVDKVLDFLIRTRPILDFPLGF